MNVSVPISAFLLTLPCAFASPLPPNGFLESEQAFFRSALIVSEKPMNRVRRGVLIHLGRSYWTCFDPDLLRYAACWKAPEGEAPLTMDTMAAVSYPDGTAKADMPPVLRGKIFTQTSELPGVGIAELPETDIRETVLTEGNGKVGPLPAGTGKFLSVVPTEGGVILTYSIGERIVHDTYRMTLAGNLERILAVSPGKESVAIGLDGSKGTISGKGDSQMVLLDSGDFRRLSVACSEPFEIRTNAKTGTALVAPPSSKQTSFRISRVLDVDLAMPRFEGYVETGARIPPFPDKVEVTSPAGKGTGSPIAERPLKLPLDNPWKRAVRPTDIAFLSNGDALITTLDGDVWRVENIAGETAVWSRAACGLFETMSIAVNAKDEVFVLGRDQITRLVDSNSDGFFDVYACASDAFPQTLHSRDYATSLELAEDGSFLIGRSGLMDAKKSVFGETVPGRGSIIRISQDGTKQEILADGLRLPFIGRRADGAIFASDQQGHFIPSSPIHLIGGGKPYLGYDPADFRKKKQPVPPLLWFPYQINRSGASFATFSEKGFPSLGDAFVHLSWSGRIFPVVTPEKGLPFAWKLPFDFDFPILGAATNPKNGRLYAVGLGISGYKPETPKTTGLAEISESAPIAAPVSLDVLETSIIVGFRTPLPSSLNLISPHPELDLWDIKRTAKYGSGHYRWDGEPGEHSVKIGKLTVSEDRMKIAIAVPTIFRSEILRLRLNLHDNSSAEKPYEIEIYARPEKLPVASKADLFEVAKRESADTVAMVPGNAESGETLFKNYGCTGCHSLDGTKLTGPPLNGIATRYKGDLDAFLKTSILEPAAVITEGYEPSMPSFEGVIQEQGIIHIVEFLKSLK